MGWQRLQSNKELKARVTGLVKNLFGNQEDLDNFSYYINQNELICLVRGDEGYIFGERPAQMHGLRDDRTIANSHLIHVKEMEELLNKNGFSCAFEAGADGVCGVSFRRVA